MRALLILLTLTASGFFLLALMLGALSRWLFRKASRMSQEP